MKKFFIMVTVLVVVVLSGCYVWINLGLGSEVTEKNLNISYNDFAYDLNVQDLLNVKLEKSYTGGPFFDDYTVYESTSIMDGLEKKVEVEVDNSKGKIEAIRLYFSPVYGDWNQELLSSACFKASLHATVFGSLVDKNMTKAASINITDMMVNLWDGNGELKVMDEVTHHGIKYSRGMTGSYAFIIEPANSTY